MRKYLIAGAAALSLMTGQAVVFSVYAADSQTTTTTTGNGMTGEYKPEQGTQQGR